MIRQPKNGLTKQSPPKLRSMKDRLTKQKRRDEMVSDLVYFPVVVNAMAVLMNFIYVAYFLQQKEALNVLFN